MSWRRLRVLIQHLPPESHTMTALRNGMSEEELDEQAEPGAAKRARWSQLEQLVAVVADAVRRLEYVTIAANTDSKAARPDPPEPIPRPGVRDGPPKTQLPEHINEQLFQLINGGDQEAG